MATPQSHPRALFLLNQLHIHQTNQPLTQRAHISRIIFTYFFSPHQRVSCLHSTFVYTSHFYVIFILFSTPYLPRFCLVLCSIFLTELEFELYCIFSPCSWHVVRFRSNIFILSQSDQHSFSVLLRVYKPSFHVAPSNIHPWNWLEFPNNSISFCALLTS